jgi:uncharacterized protein YjiK
MSDLVALRTGTILVDDYRIERVLGAGGFGITYLAEEVPLARLVTVKEYFPVDFAARDHVEDVVPRSRECEGDYTWGLDRFLAEAQTLARFNHPNIVRVYRFFQARNTGYIVLHYEEGQSLKGWLRSLGRAPRQHELDRLVEPLLDALETVHAADYLHRDIAPDNIMIRRDGSPVLIDFGSARGDIAKHSKTISALVKPGYSPYEQYATTSRQQGPWTDIYSLGATLYEAVTNRRPPDAPSRMVADELIPPGDAALSSYRPRFLAAIARSLRLDVGERPRSVAEWRTELMGDVARAEKAPAKAAAPARAEPPPVAESAASSAAAGAPPDPVEATPASAAAHRPAESRRRSLAGAFLAGWRQAASADRPALSRPKPAPPAAPPEPAPAATATPRAVVPVPAEAPPKPRRHGLFRRRPVEAKAAPEPGARRATPRAIRKKSGTRWRGLLAKLVVGFCVAGAAVAMQDQLPTVHREGAGLLTSQSNADLPVAEMKGHKGPIAGLAFTADGRSLVSASGDGTLRVWNAARGSAVRTIELDGGPATALSIADGRAAIGHKDGTVAILDLATGAKLAGFRRNEATVWALTFAGRADRLAAAANDGAVALWNTASPGAPTHALEGHDGMVRAVAYGARGAFVASGSSDGTVKLWNHDKAELVRTYRGHDELILAVAFNSEGTVLASSDRDGMIRLWSTFANRLKRRLRGHEGPVAALAFAGEGDLLASAGNDGTLRIWDAQRGKLVRTLQAAPGPLTAVCFSPDGRRLATATADGTVRIWNASVVKAGS